MHLRQLDYETELILKAREEAERMKRAQELADNALSELKQLRREQMLARDREILRRKEETLRQYLAQQDYEGEAIDLSEVQKDLSDSRRRIEKKTERNKGRCE